jgi:hypothetical protein
LEGVRAKERAAKPVTADEVLARLLGQLDLVGSRRELVRAIWDRGVARGDLRADVDPEVAIDLIFAPAMYRPVAGHAPLDDTAAEAVVDAAIRRLAH